MRSPHVACARVGGAELWVVGVIDDRACRCVRLEERVPEAVRDTGGHRAALARGQVADHDLETVCGVVHVDDQLVAVVELERVGRHHSLIAEAGVGPGWRHGSSALRDDREVDRLGTNEVVARGVVLHAGVHVLLNAVDRQRSTPLAILSAVGIGATDRPPSRRIELHLHIRLARRQPDVLGRVRVRAREDVLVRVGRAGRTRIRRVLVIAHDHPEPERRPQLKVPGAPGPVLLRCSDRIGRQRHPVLIRVSRPGTVE